MDYKGLEDQLYREKKAKENANLELKHLEKRLIELKNEISIARKQGPEHGGTESDGFKQYQAHLSATNLLEKNISLEKERFKILLDRNTNVTEMDLDILSQTELIRFVKQLERIRTDLQSNLREIQTNLDQQAQEYRRLKEMKTLYGAEMNLRDRKRRHHTTTNSNDGTSRI